MSNHLHNVCLYLLESSGYYLRQVSKYLVNLFDEHVDLCIDFRFKYHS